MARAKEKDRPERNQSLPEGGPLDGGWAWAREKTKTSRPIRQVRVLDPPRICVPRGAQWLDVMVPSWFRRLPIERVDIQSVEGCPLANAFRDAMGRPSFLKGVIRLCRPTPYLLKPSHLRMRDSLADGTGGVRPRQDLYKGSDTDQLAHHGFCPYRDDPCPDPYPILNFLWRREMTRRLEGEFIPAVVP